MFLFTISFSLCLSCCIHKDNYIKLFGIVSVLYMVEVLCVFMQFIICCYCHIIHSRSLCSIFAVVFVRFHSQPEFFFWFLIHFGLIQFSIQFIPYKSIGQLSAWWTQNKINFNRIIFQVRFRSFCYFEFYQNFSIKIQ